jgi:hypothetical protein
MGRPSGASARASPASLCVFSATGHIFLGQQLILGLLTNDQP